MHWLLLASVIWGFSFGILKDLTGGLDPFIVNIYRSGIAALFFCPWFFVARISKIKDPLGNKADDKAKSNDLFSEEAKAFICGMIQIGLMYGPYTLAFRHIKAHEVALFTMTTPLIMSSLVLIEILIRKRHVGGKLALLILTAAVLATLGGIIAAHNDLASVNVTLGAGLVTLSNVFFALGMMLWTRWFSASQNNLLNLMAPFFVGAFFVSIILSFFFAKSLTSPHVVQWFQLLWLGGISSGLGFYIWNRGALMVNASSLSVANNIKLPVAIVISIVIFGEQAAVLPLTVGMTLIMLALKLGSYLPKTTQSH